METTRSNSDSPVEVEVATIGGGCFWCTEAVFDIVEGVQKVESGYSGGQVPNPTYEEVCSGATGHAEVIQIVFKPDVISYKDILRIFFATHDPTTLNQQGSDIGTHYRSMILHHSDQQRDVAKEVIQEVDSSKVWGAKLITELRPFQVFYKAEDYHQKYFQKNPNQGYCKVIISPKVAKFRDHYREKLKPPLVQSEGL